MWLATTSPASYELAGEHGLGLLAFGMGTSAADMAKRITKWRNAMDNSTRDLTIKNENAGVFLMAFCAKTDAEAQALCKDAFVNYLDVTIDVFLRWGEHRELPPGYEWYANALQHAGEIAERMKLDYLIENKMVLVGSPDTLSEIISGFRDAGATQMVTAMQLGGIAHQDVLNSINLFGTQVIPNFQ
jgi:alkanesulfonate monooxygenase SsuD/methylene tetrahydromethanopterin reductase-like flavin-dependent oxidoreductase (luciferase family)